MADLWNDECIEYGGDLCGVLALEEWTNRHQGGAFLEDTDRFSPAVLFDGLFDVPVPFPDP